MNDLPGYRIDEVLGEVFGLTVRSRNSGSQIGASVKSLVGGELKGMTKMLAEGREHATERLVEEAEEKGANGGRISLRHIGTRRHMDRDLRLRHGGTYDPSVTFDQRSGLVAGAPAALPDLRHDQPAQKPHHGNEVGDRGEHVAGMGEQNHPPSMFAGGKAREGSLHER
jgi:uncharacterized protein YbjQ (UPF0145 family)